MPKKTGQNMFLESIDVWRQYRLEKCPLILSPPAAKSVIQRQICCKKTTAKPQNTWQHYQHRFNSLSFSSAVKEETLLKNPLKVKEKCD